MGRHEGARRARIRAALTMALLALTVGTAAGCSWGGRDALPAAAPDYVGLDTLAYAGDLKPDPARGYVTGPHGTVRIASFGVYQDDPAGKLRVADGHEFIVVSFETDPLDSLAQTRLAVVVDGVTHRLNRRPRFGLVVSVPVGRPVTFTVTDEGRTQSLDLRTGERGSDAVAAYYRPRSFTLRSGRAYRASSRGRLGAASTQVTLTAPTKDLSVFLVPWLAGHGWAPENRLWLVATGLVVNAEQSIDVPADAPSSLKVMLALTGFKVDGPTSFALRSGGTTRPPVETVPSYAGVSGGDFTGTVAFDVPATITTVELLIHPVGGVVSQGSMVEVRIRDVVPFTWSPDWPTWTLGLTLTTS